MFSFCVVHIDNSQVVGRPFFKFLSSPDNSEQNGYDGYDQQDVNDTPGAIGKEANGPDYNKD